MRGAPTGLTLATESSRIIPADAGSTTITIGIFTVSGDHPRGCGEHATRKSPDDSWVGSSPRMRGALIEI